jgi:6-phosphofructokinase
MIQGTLLYAQSGGVTAVINATAAAVISEARRHKIKVLAARDGILGALHEDLIDTSKESATTIQALAHTPGGAFGSCRYKLKSLDADHAKYQRLLEVFKAHHVRWFLYNGGNDSADTALKVSHLAKAFNYPLHCIGVPKTIDNDLALTDTCPGFGSAAKYTAVSIREATLDVAAMAKTSTRVFIYEAMGRHAGWLAAAAGLAGSTDESAPHIILLPERRYDEAEFLARVDAVVKTVGWCVVVASEGIRDADGNFVADAGAGTDAFGHAQLGGVAWYLARRVKQSLGYKVHWTLPDYLQRSARHIASKTDWIVRSNDRPYRWKVMPASLRRIANKEKPLPASFLRKDGFGISARARAYLAPLIHGVAPVPYGSDGLPKYAKLKNTAVAKQLPEWTD